MRQSQLPLGNFPVNNKTKRRNTKNKAQHYFAQSLRTARNKQRRKLKNKEL